MIWAALPMLSNAALAVFVAKYCHVNRHGLFILGAAFGASLIMAMRDAEKFAALRKAGKV